MAETEEVTVAETEEVTVVETEEDTVGVIVVHLTEAMGIEGTVIEGDVAVTVEAVVLEAVAGPDAINKITLHSF